MEIAPWGKGPIVKLKNGQKAVKIQMCCREYLNGCKSRKTVYVDPKGGFYAYNIYGKMECCIRDEVYVCRKHRSKSV